MKSDPSPQDSGSPVEAMDESYEVLMQRAACYETGRLREAAPTAGWGEGG